MLQASFFFLNRCLCDSRTRGWQRGMLIFRPKGKSERGHIWNYKEMRVFTVRQLCWKDGYAVLYARWKGMPTRCNTKGYSKMHYNTPTELLSINDTVFHLRINLWRIPAIN
ncbi:hypothetical protein CEXT_525891 [Caerostris extrusa]|uniref:Uncharacterized protein n=1 Tax=Caerostris extrusa TaxID=172846 RepID=A0AAV4PDW7_CAEEX|nr:hypothetical protein CEXT_525891 [Caerostris extrusa]